MGTNALVSIKVDGTQFRSFSKNELGRDFVVGDIHGRFDLLSSLLLSVNFDEDRDRLFSVGDLVDRGAYSSEVLSWLDCKFFHPVMGNHEQLNIGANVDDWATPASQLCITNGGEWLFPIDKGKARAIQQLFSRLPLAIEIEKHDGGKVGVVHAEPVGRDWDLLKSWLSAPEKEGEVTLKPSPNDGSYFDPMTVKELLWSRVFFKYRILQRVSGIDQVYVGHCRTRDILRLENVQYIDTSAYTEGGKLTMVDINTGEEYFSR